MRPVARGSSPRTGDFPDYREAFVPLVGRIGCYCSYCERRVPTGLAVEHIQPKAAGLYPLLEGKWDNYLLACVNCNSTKNDKDVVLQEVYLPDRDNTLAAFAYRPDGVIEPRRPGDLRAKALLDLTGLNREVRETLDDNGKLVATDRLTQRMECWAIAQDSLTDYRNERGSEALTRAIVRLAHESGFFGIWMTVFAGEPEMQCRFRKAFQGTDPSSFISATDSTLVSPRPSNGLPGAGKI